MELTREHFRSIIFFTTFDVNYHDKSALMNLQLCLAIYIYIYYIAL